VDAPLIDHHCHGVARDPLGRAELESFLTESDRPPPAGCTAFDSLLGIAVRQRCAPVLDLVAGVDPDDYVARRAELGGEEANRRLLGAVGCEALLVDTGLAGDALLGLAELARISDAAAHEIVRLESLAEAVAESGVGASEFEAAFGEALRRRAADAVAVKSIIAYRHGLDFDPRPPSSADVMRAAGRWLAGGSARLDDQVLLRHLVWEGLATGLPLQLHTGFGDPDENLARSDPALLTDFLRACAAVGPPVLLLHCYPYHRHAAYLASVFPHVYLDVGLAIPHVGRRSAAVLAETLELAPFHKLLYSSDAYGLAELYVLGAGLFREGLNAVLERLAITGTDHARIVGMIGSGNARRVYGLSESVERTGPE
jgi:predicted TIM-barrel fold metal-dependent hydrolase